MSLLGSAGDTALRNLTRDRLMTAACWMTISGKTGRAYCGEHRGQEAGWRAGTSRNCQLRVKGSGAGGASMTDEQLKAFAEHVIRGQAQEVDYMGLFELSDGSPLVPGGMLEDEDAKKVADLIRGATVTITWESAS